MAWAQFEDLVRLVQQEGPVDLYLSEDDYDRLKPTMVNLWTSRHWTDHRLLVLAFLRGYTFYRDLSEEESSFWRSFHDELGFGLINTNPTKSQYDELWEAFEAHPITNNKKFRDNSGDRQFVKTIDRVWGIHSLNSKQLIKFFIAYYRRKPGKAVTEDVMCTVLRSIDENPEDHLQQLASYERVFTSMTQAVNVILKDELEGLAKSPEELEAELIRRGVELGDSPNALRYFTNKSHNAVSTIIAALRRQRTPEQFKKYLRNHPRQSIRLPPNRQTQRASQLASQRLPYGWYVENNRSEEKHEVTPDARISLDVFENMRLDTFDNFGGIVLYMSTRSFQAQVDNQTVDSELLYTQSGQIRHLWVGTLPSGSYVAINGRVYPEINKTIRPRQSLPDNLREDISIQFNKGYFAQGKSIIVPVGEIPVGAKLTVGQHALTKETDTDYLRIEGLAPGEYEGIFRLRNAVIGKLASFCVLPPLSWNLAHEPQLVAGRMQHAQVTLPDGKTVSFTWTPLRHANGSPQRVPVELTLSDVSDIGFSLAASCVPAVFIDPKTQAVLNVVKTLNPQSVGIEIDAHLKDKPLLLSLDSQPEHSVPLASLSSLRPNPQDKLNLRACLNEQGTWRNIATIPVNTTPQITNFRVQDGVCNARIEGAYDAPILLEEVDSHSMRTVTHTLTPDEKGYIRVRLRHPQKLRPLKVRLMVTSRSVPDKVIEAEVVSPPLLEMNSSLRRGFGWSRRKENP